jgi:hypothetical protein
MARFIGYPTNHLLGVLRDPAVAASTAAELVASGFRDADVTILRGAEGADRLDGTGATNGGLARLQRLLSFMAMDQMPDMARYERAVEDGGAVLMVRVRGDQRKASVVGIIRRRDGHFINYYGRFATEEIERWAGPEPEIHGLLR